jgi:hypothetical protein
MAIFLIAYLLCSDFGDIPRFADTSNPSVLDAPHREAVRHLGIVMEDTRAEVVHQHTESLARRNSGK